MSPEIIQLYSIKIKITLSQEQYENITAFILVVLFFYGEIIPSTIFVVNVLCKIPLKCYEFTICFSAHQ